VETNASVRRKSVHRAVVMKSAPVECFAFPPFSQNARKGWGTELFGSTQDNKRQ